MGIVILNLKKGKIVFKKMDAKVTNYSKFKKQISTGLIIVHWLIILKIIIIIQG